MSLGLGEYPNRHSLTKRVAYLLFSSIHAKAKQSNSHPSTLLPIEVYTEIFTNLIGDTGDFFYGKTCFSDKLCVPTLLSAGRVCKSWQQAVQPLLYQDVRITSHGALKVFLDTLRHSRFCSHVRVKTVTFVPTKLNGTKQTAKTYLSDCLELIRGRDKIPVLGATLFRLTLSHPDVYTLVTPTTPGFSEESLSNITSLDLHAPGYGDTYQLRFSGLTLPNLRSLTLKQFGLTLTSKWIDTPKLTCLRLLDVSIFGGADHNEWLWTPKQLTRLDLVRVYDETNFLVLLLEPPPKGCGCAETLEDLVLFKLSSPTNQLLDLRLLHHLKKIKNICIGPYLFSENEHPSLYLPSTVERLTIWEPDSPEYVFWANEFIENWPGLSRFLKEKQFESFPRLKVIRVKALKDNWKKVGDNGAEEIVDVKELEEEFAVKGIKLVFRLLEGEIIHLCFERL